MCSRCLSLLLLALSPLSAAEVKTLRVCADPNNMPFSNQRGEGFENRLAGVVAGAMGARLEFVWWSERKSLVKNTLDEGRCDALMGVPSALDSATVTKPYYRSTYVFVSRSGEHLQPVSLNDSRLEKWRIGIHEVGDDYAPPAVALARRGLSANIVGFSLFGAYGEPDPPAKLIHAVASGTIDLAIAWGPLAGYFARRENPPLELRPVAPPSFMAVPFVYDISMGVRKGNDTLRAALDEALRANCVAVQAILRQYGVPRVPDGEGKITCEGSSRSPAAFWR